MEFDRKCLCAIALLSLLTLGGSPYTAPSGDLNLDGTVNVVDIQCMVLTFQQIVLGKDGQNISCVNDQACAQVFSDSYYCRGGFDDTTVCLPACLHQDVKLGSDKAAVCDDPQENSDQCLGKTAKLNADLNCDGQMGAGDLNFVVAVSLGKTGGEGTADFDSDGKLNFCDDDSDADGAKDPLDCEPLNPDQAGGQTECGQGTCKHMVEGCKDGQPEACDPFFGAIPELCNGLDDDCDGEVDDNLGSTVCGIGNCQHEQANCAAGQPQACDPYLGAEAEVCNGLDDDCDGVPDDGLGSASCGQGKCFHVVESCKNGVPQPCDPFEGATNETCNSADDDCDGVADDNLGTLLCGVPPCQVEIEACKNGIPQQCQGQGNPGTETCDGKDNDCDGKIDEEGALGCQVYYADKDKDGWGADADFKCLCKSDAVYKAFSGGDCYDGNFQAKPGQTGWYEDDRGDGSFDYNCDGQQSYQLPDLFYCNGACSYSTPGWYLFPPMCGESGLFATVCLDLFGYLCDTKTVNMVAACH